jgi:hypothetical protein
MLLSDWPGTSHVMIGRVRAKLRMNGRVRAHDYCFGRVRAHDMDYVVIWSVVDIKWSSTLFCVDAKWSSTLFGVDAKWSSTSFFNPWEAIVGLYRHLRSCTFGYGVLLGLFDLLTMEGTVPIMWGNVYTFAEFNKPIRIATSLEWADARRWCYD